MAGIKFMEALNLLIEEKGIEKDVFLEMLKESIAKAYKKNYLNSDANVRVEINEKTGKFRLFELRTVVDDLEDEDLELSLEEAQAINPFYKIGDVVETEADVEMCIRDSNNICIKGYVFKTDMIVTKSNKHIQSLWVTDYTDSIIVKR